MPPPAYRTAQRPVDTRIVNPNPPPVGSATTTAPPGQQYSGSGGPAAPTGNPLADEALGQRGNLGVTVTPGEKNWIGNRGESTVAFSGEPTLPNLDFRAVEGGIGDQGLAQGASMAARMYRNPYADLANQGGRYNPIIDRGVGARGIVGEAMAAKREGREVDPIMGRTARYAGDPNAPVDMRPLARNETEAAFWDNWQNINQKWLAGGYVKQGPGSGSELQQGKVDPGFQVPPRLERSQVGGTGNTPKYTAGYPDDDLPEDVLWEEAYTATGGKDNSRIADWLVETKGMDKETAISVAYMREYEQIEAAKKDLYSGEVKYGYTGGKTGKWEPQRPPGISEAQWNGWQGLNNKQLVVQQGLLDKGDEYGVKMWGSKDEPREHGAWRKGLDRYL